MQNNKFSVMDQFVTILNKYKPRINKKESMTDPNQNQNDLHLDDSFISLLSPSDSTNQPAQPSNQPQTSQKPISAEVIKRTVYLIKDQLDSVLRMLDGYAETTPATHQSTPDVTILNTGEKILEGAFNGEKMIGSDGQEYIVPPNYASKSKLVEGDIMKLTITRNGSFIYKQISPVNRKRLIGLLQFDQARQKWTVLAAGYAYKVLTASITFYKGKPGDEVILVVPESGQSEWGAVENIMVK